MTAFLLREQGYICYALVEGIDDRSVAGLALQHSVDLIVLDVMMPGMGGFEICRRLKAGPETSHIGIIFLSAKGCVDDIVYGLDMGADDYLAKPFEPSELLARVNACLRRILPHSLCSDEHFDDGWLHVDGRAGAVRCEGVSAGLTQLEFEVLCYLVMHRDEAVPHGVLLQQVWGTRYELVENLRRCVHGLRAKMEPDPHNPVYVCTIRGIGYCFRTKG
jgi:DNA-binding response OmpR family regulator